MAEPNVVMNAYHSDGGRWRFFAKYDGDMDHFTPWMEETLTNKSRFYLLVDEDNQPVATLKSPTSIGEEPPWPNP